MTCQSCGDCENYIDDSGGLKLCGKCRLSLDTAMIERMEEEECDDPMYPCEPYDIEVERQLCGI